MVADSARTGVLPRLGRVFERRQARRQAALEAEALRQTKLTAAMFDELLAADRALGEALGKTRIEPTFDGPPVAGFACLIDVTGGGRQESGPSRWQPGWLTFTGDRLLWTCNNSTLLVHEALRYQARIADEFVVDAGDDDEEHEDFVDDGGPWWRRYDEDDRVDANRRRMFAAPTPIEFVRKRRDDWGNRLDVRAVFHERDDLLTLLASD